ncbi:MAG: hypothetical protein GQ574_22525 [Crocinitomix sp.]|nr:hypothetical protein [Crocinitomix sp.]
MRNANLIILMFGVGGIYAQNNNCNFTVEVLGDLSEQTDYSVESFQIGGIKRRKQKKIMELMDFDFSRPVGITLQFHQAYLAAVCQYKKYRITRVIVSGYSNLVEITVIYE